MIKTITKQTVNTQRSIDKSESKGEGANGEAVKSEQIEDLTKSRRSQNNIDLILKLKVTILNATFQ